MINNIFKILRTPWVIALILLISGSLLLVSYSLIGLSRPASAPNLPMTAILTVIPAPTATLPGITATSAVDLTSTPLASKTPFPGTIAPGAYVQVAGTGGDGLRLRTSPGLESEVRYLGLEAEVFLVQEGPQQSDGYTWWLLVAPYDDSRLGWSVADYLVVIQNPSGE